MVRITGNHAKMEETMKKVINGKLYNTETADEIVDISNRRYWNDKGNFHWEDTRLYRTKKGAWFIAGQGYALSRWGTLTGNGSGPGSGLHVIDADEARDYLERYGSADLVAEHFPVEEA